MKQDTVAFQPDHCRVPGERKITYHVIGDTAPKGLCGSGLLDLVAVLQDRIIPIGNAAGEGAKLCALSRKEVPAAGVLQRKRNFRSLPACPNFRAAM